MCWAGFLYCGRLTRPTNATEHSVALHRILFMIRRIASRRTVSCHEPYIASGHVDITVANRPVARIIRIDKPNISRVNQAGRHQRIRPHLYPMACWLCLLIVDISTSRASRGSPA